MKNEAKKETVTNSGEAGEIALEKRLIQSLGREFDETKDRDKPPFVSRELAKKAELFAERHAVYGDNYHRFGPILSIMMETQSLNVHSTHDMGRLGIMVQIISKMTRYCENFNRGGHDDSLDDIAVYAMMLKELDRN